MKRLLFGSFALLLSVTLFAQKTFPKNGVADHREGLYAFTRATLHVAPGETLENATLLIRDGKIEEVGPRVRIPKDAIVINLKDRHIYPSFIEIYSSYGLPEPEAVNTSSSRSPQMLSNKKGAYMWNEALRPEFHAHEHFSPDAKEAGQLRKLGFGAALTHQMNGISRGASTLVALGDEKAHEHILRDKAAHHLSFSKGKSTQNYPRSLMGVISLLRQTYYDGKWYKDHGRQEEFNISLEAWNDLQDLPQVFEAGNWLNALRANEIGKEFGHQYILKGGGDEYQRLDAIRALNTPLIVPLEFPDPYDVEDAYDARMISLEQLKHWELAPANPGRLAAAGVPLLLTTHGLKKKSEFFKNLRKAIEYGLSEEAALAALTTTPAKILAVENQLGSLEKGKIANFIITSGTIFDQETTIYHNWVQGKAYVLKPLDDRDLRGKYTLKAGLLTFQLEVAGKAQAPSMKIRLNDSTTIDVDHHLDNHLITLTFKPGKQLAQYRLSGVVDKEDQWSGNGTDLEGQWIEWTAVRESKEVTTEEPEEKEEKEENANEEKGAVIFPFAAYGRERLPQSGKFLVRNATVWTNEEAGILTSTDVLVENGKIVALGAGLDTAGTQVIDGAGKHLTCGIIDEHTHIGINRGVNEGTQASSAEVRIGDVINSEDVNIYRQLAGGVVAAQLLHGSANPIGGQSGIIKFRWGWLPEEMKIRDAAPFIKFALGENVKQSNWGANNRSRFPQTRMGVEEVYDDHFTRAREYGTLKRSGKPYRTDLELEALLEILEGKRFITCHSYQQGEINMLMKVAERYGFRINTFTHILEGYKVADKMAAHGAGGSSFSDWWAYKYEVIDAIPHNAAIMHEQGVVVAINSDDAEMARRLNQEAAKCVLYGSMSEEEAWKTVTLNPARLLHLDHRMGSIREGKDADLVLWSDNPLSIYAKAEKTWVDGRLQFDIEEDQQLREQMRKERARLIQKMLQARKKGAKTQPVKAKKEKLYHCDDMEDEGY